MTPDQERLETEFLVATAVRDTMQTLQQRPVSYPEAMEVGAQLIPKLLDPETSLLFRSQEPAPIREFREIAAAMSFREGRQIIPEDVIKSQIAELERLLVAPELETKNIKRKLSNLRNYLLYFQQRALSEHALLIKDVFQAERPLVKSTFAYDRHRSFNLGGGRVMNLRLLHPDKPEHICGADVIYERYDEVSEIARVAFAQYKVWHCGVINISDLNPKQLRRMENVLCKTGLCAQHSAYRKAKYRLPCCSAFLRLTNKLQRPDSRLISAGCFVPICRLPQKARGSISVPELKGFSLSSDLFERGFMEDIVGSEWMDVKDLEQLYRDIGVFDTGDRIVIHASESFDVTHGMRHDFENSSP